MERRHAKGPSLAIGTVLGSLGGSIGGGSFGGVTPPVGLGSLGALLGTAVAGSLEVFPLIGIFDNIGLWGNTVFGSLLNSVLGSIGTSSGSLLGSSGTLLPFFGSGLPASDSLVNSGLNSFNSISAGPGVNSLINLF